VLALILGALRPADLKALRRRPPGSPS